MHYVLNPSVHLEWSQNEVLDVIITSQNRQDRKNISLTTISSHQPLGKMSAERSRRDLTPRDPKGKVTQGEQWTAMEAAQSSEARESTSGESPSGPFLPHSSPLSNLISLKCRLCFSAAPWFLFFHLTNCFSCRSFLGFSTYEADHFLKEDSSHLPSLLQNCPPCFIQPASKFLRVACKIPY